MSSNDIDAFPMEMPAAFPVHSPATPSIARPLAPEARQTCLMTSMTLWKSPKSQYSPEERVRLPPASGYIPQDAIHSLSRSALTFAMEATSGRSPTLRGEIQLGVRFTATPEDTLGFGGDDFSPAGRACASPPASQASPTPALSPAPDQSLEDSFFCRQHFNSPPDARLRPWRHGGICWS